MIRAVLDTSVLVPPSTRKELQLAAADGRFVALWSPWIIAELNRVLTWLWIEGSGGDLSLANQQRCSQAAKAMMRILASTFVVINVRPALPRAWDSLTDADDVPIWATAVVGAATHVVSANTRHFPPRQPDGRHIYDGIEYLTAADFLLLLADASGAHREPAVCRSRGRAVHSITMHRQLSLRLVLAAPRTMHEVGAHIVRSGSLAKAGVGAPPVVPRLSPASSGSPLRARAARSPHEGDTQPTPRL